MLINKTFHAHGEEILKYGINHATAESTASGSQTCHALA
jgi:hypothetical protein